jgi:hypothetical protein
MNPRILSVLLFVLPALANAASADSERVLESFEVGNNVFAAPSLSILPAMPSGSAPRPA